MFIFGKTLLMVALRKIVKYWYVPLLVGILYIILGIWSFNTPVETFLTLAFLFSISFIISGILEIAFAVANRHLAAGWAWRFLSGVIDLVLGSLLLARPEFSFATLTVFVAFWLLFRSFLAIGNSIDLSKIAGSGWGFQLIFGILGVLAGVVLLLNPLLSGIYLVFLVSVGLVTIGIYHIIFALKVKNIKDFGKNANDKIHEIERAIIE